MQSVDTSEKRFESDIESALISDVLGDSKYEKISRTDYNAELALFPDVLVRFIKNSQPKSWERYEKLYGVKAQEKLIRRFNDSVEANGIIYVLKHGFKDMGIDIKLCYFKPESDKNKTSVDNYKKNILGVTRQFPYSTKNNNTIDMVISLNGIPLFAFELKDQLTGQTYEDAIIQWCEDRDPKEYCFKFNRRFLTYFAVDLYEVYMSTELKGYNNFIPFNQGSNGPGVSGRAGNPENPNGYVTSYLWEKVFAKDSVMELIHRYISLITEKKEEYVNGVKKTKTTTKIIFPRYHQYDVCEKIIKDVKEKGSGTNYLIDHSAGSGKSNTIAWLTYRLASAFDNNDNMIFDSVIIVTNRIVLDSQLQDTITGFDHRAGLVECVKTNSDRKLKDAINDKKKIIICTIQKFRFGYKDFSAIKDRNFAIIIDEAHQGQSGESARTLRKSLIDKEKELQSYCDENGIDIDDIDESDAMLTEIISQGHHDNQSFFAFTATPIKSTLAVFGTLQENGSKKPFHTYSMRQAIDEGFILDVLKSYMTVREAFKLVKDCEDNPELLEAKTKKALIRYYKQHDFTIHEKVEMIMENFLNNCRRKIDGHGKAMVVADSRHNAVRYYFAIKEYIKNHKDTCNGVGLLVAFSGDVKFDDDNTVYNEANLNIDSEGNPIKTDKKFREAFKSDAYNIMVVANKYQTGYDEPLLHTMYVDKKLRNVNAVQTLSRLNRTCKDKIDTFVLDFANTVMDIKNSFQPYYENIELEGDININSVYDFRARLDEFALFSVSEVDAFVNLMKKGSSKGQDSKLIGKLTSILKPVVDRYLEFDLDKRFSARDALMKFNRRYSFITQLVRIDDKDLFKDYLFTSHLLHMLPKNKVNIIDITDKIQLEYAKLDETYKGAIILDSEDKKIEGDGPIIAKKRETKTDTLERIIEKVNLAYDGDFGPNDKVVLDSVYKMLMEDAVVKQRLQEYAVDNDANMFIKSIFPNEFQRILVNCYALNDEAFRKLLGDSKFQKLVMDTMAKEFYKELNNKK